MAVSVSYTHLAVYKRQECISTRYLLSRYMDEDQGNLLRSDILENLGHRHYDSPAYQLFKELLYDGGDPSARGSAH